MSDNPVWFWQVIAVAAAGGLGLGIWIDSVRRKRQKAKSKRRVVRPPAEAERPSMLHSQLPGVPPASGFRSESAQTRLLERLRENNLELAAKVKALTEQHARAFSESNQQQEAEKIRQERQLEELRQAHSGELAHLMSVLVEQVDGIHKAHASQVKNLEAELERLRTQGGGASAGAPTAMATEFANTIVSTSPPRL